MRVSWYDVNMMPNWENIRRQLNDVKIAYAPLALFPRPESRIAKVALATEAMLSVRRALTHLAYCPDFERIS